MKLKLESKYFRNNLDDTLPNFLIFPNIKQLRDHDPKGIIWDALKEPIEIKLEDQIYTPIDNQLKNTHI